MIKRRVMRNASVLVLAMTVAAALAACSSPPAPTLATTTAACRSHSPVPHAPGGSAAAAPGGVQWAAIVARCVTGTGQQWSNGGAVGPRPVWATPAPGGKLAVFVNGVVSMYSDAGTVLWRRGVAPAAWNTRLQSLSVSQSVVLVAFTAPGNSVPIKAVSTFLNATDGEPLGKTDVPFASPPFLVGNHVLEDSATGSALEGYDPATGRTLWSTPVPGAPDWQAEVDDGSVVYLNSAASTGDAPPAMRRVDRLDAATGRMLPPVTLSRPLHFDLTSAGGNSYAQGLLVLLIVPPCGSPGCTASQTVAVDPGNGAIRWSHTGNVQAAPSGLFSQNVSDDTLTAVDPGTGQDAWTWNQPGQGSINTDGGPDPLLLQPDGITAWTTSAKSGTPALIGISPHTGQQTWASRALPDTMYMSWDSGTVYVFSCTPWNQGTFGLCSSVTLFAIAA